MNATLSPETVLAAYTNGLFPWGDEQNTRWCYFDPRCIIDLDSFHVPKRLLRKYKQQIFNIRINTAWDQVIRLCAARPSTWISAEIIRVFTELHKLGFAHSIEAFNKEELVGGIYGISLGGAFMAESMFHTATDASKICLVYLVERIRSRGYVLFDVQQRTEHIEQFGATLIPHTLYLERLAKALTINCRFE